MCFIFFFLLKLYFFMHCVCYSGNQLQDHLNQFSHYFLHFPQNTWQMETAAMKNVQIDDMRQHSH